MNKSFRSGSKSKSSSTSFITLHFNKADDDQLEFNYSDLKDDDEDSKKDDVSPSTSTHSDEEKPKSFAGSSTSTSRESPLKSLWAKNNKQGCEVAVEPEKKVEAKEKWAFKDIKEKFVRSLEERKGSSKNSNDKYSFLEEASSSFEELDSDHTPTENPVLLSPAIEVSETIDKDSAFDNFIDDELQRVKHGIISKPKSNSGLPSPKDQKHTAEHIVQQKTEKNKETKNISPQRIPDRFDKKLANFMLIHYYHSLRSYWENAFFKIAILAVALLFAPIPSWFTGFVTGALLSGYSAYILFKPAKPKEPFVMPDFSHLPPSNIQVTEVEGEPTIYKGWMNELPSEYSYNPDTYHVNSTKSIYIRLDGSYLRISYPQANIPKRAMFNEGRHDMQFIYQQHYDVTGSCIELLPVGLARKRLWSKKYPICLKIANPLTNPSKDNTTKTPLRKDSSPIRRHNPRINDYNEVVLYLFSRTDREKDLWFHRLKKASRLKLFKSHVPTSSPNIAASMDSNGGGAPSSRSLENRRATSIDLTTLRFSASDSERGSDDYAGGAEDEVDAFTDLCMSRQQKFELYMSQLLASVSRVKYGDVTKAAATPNSLSWLNVLIGRVCFDFLMEDVWAKMVTEKIQKKISKLKLPSFVKELLIKDINLGTALPRLHRASEPTVDQRGLWVDVDVSYNGSFQMTLETKINLLSRKCDTEELDGNMSTSSLEQVLRSPVYNSDEEDSAESSTDDETSLPPPELTSDSSAVEVDGSPSQGGAGKKLLRMVDRFAQSSYFQHAAKNKYIKKAMEDISNMPLLLTVEVQWLTGTMALNIPPMPTDRIWYGFRTNPHLSIVARPKLGQRAVRLTHVTEWIEKKLVSEFQKILVLPNMDDLIIPIMMSDTDLP